MSNRDFGVSALGRFLAVERYRESQQLSSSTYSLLAPADRTSGSTNKPDSRTGSRAPARPQHR
jgi:hypothetical protein